MTNGLNALPSRLNAHGTASNNTIQQVAGSIGTALLIAIMNAKKLTSFEQDVFEETGQKTATMTEGQLEVMQSQFAQQALLDGINLAFLIAALFAVIALILSFS